MRRMNRPGTALILLFVLWLTAFAHTAAESFSVKRIGNLIPFNDNVFAVYAPEEGELSIRIHDDISVYRIIEQTVEAGETTIHWDGCAFNHERLAPKNYTVTAELTTSSGDKYAVSFNTPVEYTGQCLQYLLPSSGTVSLTEPEAWFVEFRTVQKGTVTFVFTNTESSEEQTFRINTTGGRINRLTYPELTGKNPPGPGEYSVTAYENSRRDESYQFELSIWEEPPEKREVFLTGEILPREGMTEGEIWDMMQQPSVVVDIDPFKHQRVFSEKDEKSASLGTLHGQTQALQVFRIEDEWAYIGAWNHEEAEYVEGWVPVSVLKVTDPDPDYGLLINKQQQTLDVYYQGKRIDTLEVSTGRPDKKHSEQETAAGSFLTGYHRVDFSMNGKKYDYVIQYDGGNLLHQIPYEWGKDKKDFSLGRSYLGAKASHACIRIQSEPGENGINAYWIWTHIPYHTRVLILDDPDQRRPVTERPAVTDGPVETEGDHQVRLSFEDEKQQEKEVSGATVEEIEGHLFGFARCSEKAYVRNPELISEMIHELQQEGCERIILKCFWSDSNNEMHTAVQEAMARKGVKAGADLVIGNGNKTLLGCEWYEKSLILYGLGKPNGKKSSKQDLNVPEAEVIFDFDHPETGLSAVFKTSSDETDTDRMIEQFVNDSVGPGISRIWFQTGHQSKQ